MSVPTESAGLPKGYQEYVVGFAIHQDCALLIRKTKPAWQNGKLNGVGGKIEKGEKPIDAMIREFREETGLTMGEDWMHRFTLDGPDYRVYFYSVEQSFAGHRNLTEEKLVAVNLKHLPVDLIYNLRWMLPLVLDRSINFPITFKDGVPSADSTGVNK